MFFLFFVNYILFFFIKLSCSTPLPPNEEYTLMMTMNEFDHGLKEEE